MDLVRHLYYFTVVAEERHFGNAAIRLGMAQPPLSQRIKRLEEELGVRLFDRSSRHVRLTEAGRLLLPEAREVIARVERLRELVRHGEARTLKVALPPDLGATAIAALVARFREENPELRLAPAEMWTADQVAALAEGTIDVGVVRHPVTAPGLRFGEVLVQAAGVLLAEADPLAVASSVHLQDLADRELLLFPQEGEPGAHAETLADCRRHGFVPAEVHHGIGLGLVLAGSAVAFGPREAERLAPEGVIWRPLLGSPLIWRVSTAWRAGTPEVAAFATVAVQALKESGGMAEEGVAPARQVRRRPAMGFLA
ncbi:LysR family transcriptional regulator [Nonomuraea sp. NPDC003804]|uniref:LysR family transcriptional regulator n=1 Tax=Nonomuraea sp. NPDC003804 TaxID=3154547 RepID=UPI0033A12D8F